MSLYEHHWVATHTVPSCFWNDIFSFPNHDLNGELSILTVWMCNNLIFSRSLKIVINPAIESPSIIPIKLFNFLFASWKLTLSFLYRSPDFREDIWVRIRTFSSRLTFFFRIIWHICTLLLFKYLMMKIFNYMQ